ncbi:L-threonylcarbamoyladenylate synthase [Nocardia sp. NPDC060249]|uniref:L-threonylcarbamoyladenylate synthase n=1 Tax=Nocardia sp. NPDC060249 TaxID=3347082 RepID=UPI00366416EA
MEALDNGKIIIVPTERWYMLCADSTDGAACSALFVGKGRDAAKPLALVMPTNQSVEARFYLSEPARRLSERLWPGNMALLLSWRNHREASGRWWLGSHHAMVTRDPGILGRLAADTRNTIATTVVSRSTAPTSTDRQPALSADDVERFIALTSLSVELFIDGGDCPVNQGLTVVDCTSVPMIVREGAVASETINDLLARSGRTGAVEGRTLSTSGSALDSSGIAGVDIDVRSLNPRDENRQEA